jgi:hypothetical protein
MNSNINNTPDNSSLHMGIKNYINECGNVSHILNVIISLQTTSNITNQIRQQVFNKINNIPIMFKINGMEITITWRSNSVSNYYYTNMEGIYGDMAVKLHTEMLLNLIDMSSYNNIEGESILAFMATKSLAHTVPVFIG